MQAGSLCQEPRPELTMITIIIVYFTINYPLLVDPHNTTGVSVRVSWPVNGQRNKREDLKDPCMSVTDAVTQAERRSSVRRFQYLTAKTRLTHLQSPLALLG